MHLCNCNAYSNASGSPVGCVWNTTIAPYCPFFSRETARYLVSWLRGAKTDHGLEFDFIGMWNERQFTTAFTIMFREELDAAGFESVRLVATDNGACCNFTVGPAEALKEGLRMLDIVWKTPNVLNIGGEDVNMGM